MRHVLRKENNVRKLATAINDHCDRNELFWAGGLIKETLSIWQNPANRSLLCRTAKNMIEKMEE